MKTAQQEYLGLDFQPRLVSSSKARDKARARSASPSRAHGHAHARGRASHSPARALASSASGSSLPAASPSSLSVFDRLNLEGRNRLVRRREAAAAAARDPQCTFKPTLYTRSPSALSAASGRSRADDDSCSLASDGLTA